MKEHQIFTRAFWEVLLQYQILEGKSYATTLLDMVKSGIQPNEKTVLLMLDACKSRGDFTTALDIYKLQTVTERRIRACNQAKSKKDKINSLPLSSISEDRTADIIGMALPPPSRATIHYLLELLRDNKDVQNSIVILQEMYERSSHSYVNRQKASVRFPGSDMIRMNLPDLSTYGIVLETCILAGKVDESLMVFKMLEENNFEPDRRIYAALIRLFSITDDMANALGVFEEMRMKYVPDVATLHSLLSICKENPSNLRSICAVLNDMEESGYDLSVYSKDLLLQAFPDAVALGKSLIALFEAFMAYLLVFDLLQL
jgi:pentatricopeptide repeat protein